MARALPCKSACPNSGPLLLVDFFLRLLTWNKNPNRAAAVAPLFVAERKSAEVSKMVGTSRGIGSRHWRFLGSLLYYAFELLHGTKEQEVCHRRMIPTSGTEIWRSLAISKERHGESTKNNRRGIGAGSQKVSITVVVMM
jgi:hypothetical protein